MNDFDKKVRKLVNKEINVPSHVSSKIENTLENLPDKEMKFQKHILTNNWKIIAASIAFFLLVFMPNVSVAYAQAIQNVPILGEIVRVFTIKNYYYEDEQHELNAAIPHVINEKNSVTESLINKDIEELTTAIINKFYEELKVSEDGYGSIHIDYEVITDNSNWFTLKLDVSETAGSSDMYTKYYHIDRKCGEYVALKDLIAEDGRKAIEEYIISEMKRQMAEDENIYYFIEDEFTEEVIIISEESNFYYNENGDLVIAYNKYDVAPGYMGCPKFIIPNDIYVKYIYLK